MARVNLEESLFGRDAWKVTLIAQRLGLDEDAVLGKLARVYRRCQDKMSEALSDEELDAAARTPGFARSMVAADLADDMVDGTVPRGMKKRITDLRTYVDRSAEGGRRTQSRKDANKSQPIAQAPAKARA